VYSNADDALHSVRTKNREFFVGQCFAVKAILDLPKKIEKELG